MICWYECVADERIHNGVTRDADYNEAMIAICNMQIFGMGFDEVDQTFDRPLEVAVPFNVDEQTHIGATMFQYCLNGLGFSALSERFNHTLIVACLRSDDALALSYGEADMGESVCFFAREVKIEVLAIAVHRRRI